MGSSLKSVSDALFTEKCGYPLHDWVADQLDDGTNWVELSRRLANKTDGVLVLPAQTLTNWFGYLLPDPANGEEAA